MIPRTMQGQKLFGRSMKCKLNRKIKKSIVCYISIAGVLLLLQVAAWNSRSFSDAYIAYIFPVWVNTYGRLTGIFPFSVGEWMIAAGIAVVFGAALLGCSMLLPRCRHSEKYRRGVRRYFCFFAWTVLFVFAIMTLNCTMIYHGSTFSEKYITSAADGKTSGESIENNGNSEISENSVSVGQVTSNQTRTEQLLQIYNDIVAHCNELSTVVERDSTGAAVYIGGMDSTGKTVDMEDKAIDVMQNLGKTYDQLDGYYPRPKPMFFSDFMCQMYMCGYYFPFSMEANYNDVMYLMKKPATMCHELAHIRGYIYEDEANFIAFLACISSDDVTFQYSGYLSVLNYVANDLYRTRLADPESYAAAREAVRPLQVMQRVQEDNIFVAQEEWDRINGKAIVDTETVDSVSDTLTDASLKMNGVSDGMVSYNRVVELLLQWYEVNGDF